MENKYTEIISKLQKELHYSSSKMRQVFSHLYEEERKETLRLTKRSARIFRYKIIKK